MNVNINFSTNFLSIPTRRQTSLWNESFSLCRLTGANTAYCVYCPGPENMSIKTRIQPRIHQLHLPAAHCASLLRSYLSVRHSWRRIPGFQESPSVTVSLSDRGRYQEKTIRKKKNLPTRGITGVNPPPPISRFCPRMRMRPTCRCWSGKESGASGRANRCCIWKSGRFREAKLRRGAAGVLPSSRCTSGTSRHRHTVIFGHTRTDSLTLDTVFLLDAV